MVYTYEADTLVLVLVSKYQTLVLVSDVPRYDKYIFTSHIH